MRLYDSSTVSPSLLDMLMKAGCADVALALAWTGPTQKSTKLQQAAIKAAAGQWQDAVSAVVETHKQTIYYPRFAMCPIISWFYIGRAERQANLDRITGHHQLVQHCGCASWRSARRHWHTVRSQQPSSAGKQQATGPSCSPSVPYRAISAQSGHH